MKAKKTAKMSDDKIVKETIKKYGEVINLKETPFVLIEILRDFRSRLEPGDGGSPPGGVGGGGPATRKVDNELLLREILKLGREVSALKQRLG